MDIFYFSIFIMLALLFLIGVLLLFAAVLYFFFGKR